MVQCLFIVRQFFVKVREVKTVFQKGEIIEIMIQISDRFGDAIFQG